MSSDERLRDSAPELLKALLGMLKFSKFTAEFPETKAAERAVIKATGKPWDKQGEV